MYSFKRFWILLLLPVAVVIIGTIGMMAIEHLSFLDAFYFTIVTIATVGYGDITPATTGGKIFCIFLIIIGIGTFLTILTNIAERLLHRRQRDMHHQRLNMLIGVFFTEVGNELLRIFTGFDPNIDGIRQDFKVAAQWTEKEFTNLRKRLHGYEHTIDNTTLDLDMLHRYLKEKGDLLIRQLENADLIENETFTELLWAVVHLRDELAARSTLARLPESDTIHLANDVKRAYVLLTRQWLEYMVHLKNRYPFLFSLAVRTNPFVENPSAIVK
ncbi:MAG: potassium channel family protein [Dehalococcoidales bacterium]